jgi:transcription antitermination protein NusB
VSEDDSSTADPAAPAVPHSAAPAARADSPAAADAKPPAQRKTSTRRRSRELALQGLYQWLLSGEQTAVIDAHIREQEDFKPCDTALFERLLHGCIAEAADLDASLARHVDRKTSQLSPVEHGVLMIGAYELKHCVDVPYRVVINEAVELAKSFGGTDGHKYVNGVIDKIAADLRPAEVEAARAARR